MANASALRKRVALVACMSQAGEGWTPVAECARSTEPPKITEWQLPYVEATFTLSCPSPGPCTARHGAVLQSSKLDEWCCCSGGVI